MEFVISGLISVKFFILNKILVQGENVIRKKL